MINDLSASNSVIISKDILLPRKINQVVVAVDMSDDAPLVIKYVSLLLKPLKTRIKLIFTYENHYRPQSTIDFLTYKKNVDFLCQKMRQAGSRFDYEVCQGIASRVLIEKSSAADLIVFQAGHLSPLRDSLFKTDTYHTIYGAKSLVLVLPEVIPQYQSKKLLIFGTVDPNSWPIAPKLIDIHSCIEYVYVSDFSGMSSGQQDELLFKHQSLEKKYKLKYPTCDVVFNAIRALSLTDAILSYNKNHKIDLLALQFDPAVRKEKSLLSSSIRKILNQVEVPILIP